MKACSAGAVVGDSIKAKAVGKITKKDDAPAAMCTIKVIPVQEPLPQAATTPAFDSGQ